MLGGATDLQKGKAGWYAGDLSGFWRRTDRSGFRPFINPVAELQDQRLE